MIWKVSIVSACVAVLIHWYRHPVLALVATSVLTCVFWTEYHMKKGPSRKDGPRKPNADG